MSLFACKNLTCPMAFCHGVVNNIKRHLVQVHKVDDVDECLKTLKLEKTSIARTENKTCSICSEVCSRMNVHLSKVHRLSRGTKKFKDLLSAVSIMLVIRSANTICTSQLFHSQRRGVPQSGQTPTARRYFLFSVSQLNHRKKQKPSRKFSQMSAWALRRHQLESF